MRRSFGAALALLALAVVAAGCGGGAEATVDPAAAAATPPVSTDPGATTVGATGDPGAATGGADAGADVPGANEIANADASAGELVRLSAMTPKKFKQAHCAKPIIVIYYQPGSIVDEKLVGEATAAIASMKSAGVVDLWYTPRDVKAFGDLGSKLGLFATPGLATVGRDGRIENFWTTYVDRALIERSLHNAAAAHPCKVAGDDVPAAGSALKDATLVANGGTVKNSASTGTLAAGTTPAATTGAATTTASGSGAPLTGSIDTAQTTANAMDANLAATTAVS